MDGDAGSARLLERIQSLEQRLKRSKAQAAQAEAQAAQEQRAREEAEVQAAQAEAQAAQAEAQAAQDREAREEADYLLRKTTLAEYLDLCQRHLFDPISVQTNKSWTTQGGVTSPKGKLRPITIRPWTDFLEEQRAVFDRLFQHYPLHDGPRVFESASGVAALERKVRHRPLASEIDLMMIENLAIEDPVTDIVRSLAAVDAVREEFRLPASIQFDNHINSLNSDADEVAERVASQMLDPIMPVTPLPGRRTLCPDQICVYFRDGDEYAVGRPAFVVEYKAAHKVTTAMLRAGLHEMELAEVINSVRVPGPNDEEGLFRYHAERVAAAVLTQTFSYMIRAGTRRGYMTMGETIVFLRIPSKDASTLEFHLAEPRLDVEAQHSIQPAGEFLHRTAVSQVVAFSLAALESPVVSQKWQERAIESLPVWEVDYHAILAAIPETIRRSPPTSNYVPRTVPLSASRRGSLHLRSRRVSGGCANAEPGPGRESSDSSDDDEHAPPHPTPTRRPRRSPRLGQQTSVIPQPSSSRRGRPKHGSRDRSVARKFCTSACLLGVKRGTTVDLRCANVQAHLVGKGLAGYHRLSATSLLQLLREQLARDRDHEFGPLGPQGARGALFWVRLSSHGYTMVAKGTREVFRPELDHEQEIYQHLERLQGRGVPVCLGRVDLFHPYRFRVVPFQHFLLLSWAGIALHQPTAMQQIQNEGYGRTYWEDQLTQILNAVRREGVIHGDIREANVLWDADSQQLCLLDFERSQLVSRSTRVLRPISADVAHGRAVSLKHLPRRKSSFSSRDAALAATLVKNLNL